MYRLKGDVLHHLESEGVINYILLSSQGFGEVK